MRYHRLVIIVLDTSVFVSALLGPTGASREVLRACLSGRLQPLMGIELPSSPNTSRSYREPSCSREANSTRPSEKPF